MIVATVTLTKSISGQSTTRRAGASTGQYEGQTPLKPSVLLETVPLKAREVVIAVVEEFCDANCDETDVVKLEVLALLEKTEDAMDELEGADDVDAFADVEAELDTGAFSVAWEDVVDTAAVRLNEKVVAVLEGLALLGAVRLDNKTAMLVLDAVEVVLVTGSLSALSLLWRGITNL